MEALRTRNEHRLRTLVPSRISLPGSALTPDMVPAGAPWSPFGLVQCFALTFDGYAHCDDPHALLDQAKGAQAAGGSLAGWSTDHLRAALFALQREYHDAWGDPDPALVDTLLGWIQQRIGA